MRNYIIAGSLGILLAALYFFLRTPSGEFTPSHLTIDTLRYGEFVEWIPQTGTIKHDTVIVPIDEMYLPKISKGLKATTSLNNQEFQLAITYIYPSIINGRFQVAMSFNGEAPKIPADQRLRLRILLGEPSNELLLPMGNFYGDTRGEWVFVLQGDRAVKREVKLGRRMGSDYFEVKEGLKAGERVITSSYEPFINRDSLDVAEIVRLYK